LHYRVCAAPGYLQQAGTPAHPGELPGSGHRIVGFNSALTGRPLPFVLHRGGERVAVQCPSVLAVNDGSAYLAAGLAGLGLVRLPHYMAAPHLACGELLPLFEGWHLDPQPLYLAFAPGRQVSARLRVFIDWVVALMAAHVPLSAPAPAALS
jgi:DNA-binding transcriptional LysR family regulator